MTLPKHAHRLGGGLLAVVAAGLIGLSLNHLAYAASGSLSLSPSSGSVTVGNDLTVTLYENSGSDTAIGVTAVIDYSSNLQFVSASTVAPFSVAPPDSASGGVLSLTRGAYSSQTGNQEVSVLTFKVLSAGSGSLSFNNSSSTIAPASGTGNLLVTSSGGSYSLSAAATSPPAAPPSSPAASTASPAAPHANQKSTSVSVAPATKASSAVTVPNNGSVAVSTPVTVQPATVQPDGVKKVAYYLQGKLVDTETKAPYRYHIDTSKLKNGTYNLVSKTYYTNGMVKQATQHLVVRNTAAHHSLTWLYLLILGILILLGLGGAFIGPSGEGPLRRLLQQHLQPPAPPGPAGGGYSGYGSPPPAPPSGSPAPAPTPSPAAAAPLHRPFAAALAPTRPDESKPTAVPPAAAPKPVTVNAAPIPPKPPAPAASPEPIVASPTAQIPHPAETAAGETETVSDRLSRLQAPSRPLPGTTIAPRQNG